MRCYFNLVSSHHTITDDEGLEVVELNEARTFAREAVAEMVQDGVAEIAHWRGWEMEARDASGTVLFTMGFDAPLTVDARKAEAQVVAEALPKEDGTYAYDRVIALENFGCLRRLEDVYAAVSMGSGACCGGRILVDLCGFEGPTDGQRPAARSARHPGDCLVHSAVRGRGLLGHGAVRTGQGAVPAPVPAPGTRHPQPRHVLAGVPVA